MPILVDGNNLLYRLPRGQRSREAVRRTVLDRTRHERLRVTVVFDGAAPVGSAEREHLGSVTVLYAGSRSADDVIIDLIPTGHPARQWTVITDDGGLRRRAAERGAAVRSLAEWAARRPRPAPTRRSAEPKLSSREIDEWTAWFESSEAEE